MAKEGKKAKPGSMDELAELYPGERVLQVRVRAGADSEGWEDCEVRVGEMDIRQIAQAATVLRPIAPDIGPDASFIVLAAEHPDEICAALGVAIRWDAQRVGMLGGASFGRVAAAVWEVNQDFFGQLIALLVGGANRATVAAPNGAGPTLSGISSAGATSTPPH